MFRFFSPKFNPTTFETDLDNLSKKIAYTERNIVEGKKSIKKFRREFAAVMIAGYVCYLVYYLAAVFFYGMKLDVVFTAALAGAPILIHVLLMSVTSFESAYSRYQLKKLKHYKKRQEEKIAQLKEETNFHKTRRLLQKYSHMDLKEDASQQKPVAESSGIDLLTQNDDKSLDSNDSAHEYTTELPQIITTAEDELEELERKYDEREKLRQKRNLIKAGRYVPESQRKNLLSKIFDVLIGADESSIENRYALICINCFAHNGLAPPRFLPNQVRFVCYKCNTMNNAEAEGVSNLSTPLSSNVSSPVATPNEEGFKI